MKKIQLLLAITFLGIFQLAHAQKDSSGIYKTATDFTKGKLSLAINCTTEKHKIKVSDFLGKDDFTVVHQGQNYTFKKSEVYGYLLCSGEVYRFSGNKDYLLVNPKEEILLYKVEISGSKANAPKEVKYYFSKDAASPVLELTILNVKNAFPQNHAFHDAIDATFNTDTDLASYDSFHKMYKLNWLLKQHSN